MTLWDLPHNTSERAPLNPSQRGWYPRGTEGWLKLRRVELLMTLHLRATGCHLPYGITQCYLPPDTSEHTPPKPSQTGWYSIFLPWRDGRLSWPGWLLRWDALQINRLLNIVCWCVIQLDSTAAPSLRQLWVGCRFIACISVVCCFYMAELLAQCPTPILEKMDWFSVNVNVRVFSAPPTQTGPARHYNSLNMHRIGSVG